MDGVIYGAKEISNDKLRSELEQIAADWPDAGRFFDPHYFATLIAAQPGARLGYLIGDKGHGYFRAHMRRDLEQVTPVREDIRACLRFQAALPVTGLISPNIVVRRNLDSIEAVIAKSFIRHAPEIAREVAPDRELYVTLAISQAALTDRNELRAFLQEITELDDPPAGFYLLLEKLDTTPQPSLTERDCLSRWMLVNHTLKVSGFKIINGYTDLLAPYIAATGADAVATGWFGTLKCFSLRKFEPNDTIASRAVPRYTSASLLKSIRHAELHDLRDHFPEILNNLPSDAFYPIIDGSRPDLTAEAVQNWEGIRAMIAKCERPDVSASLDACSTTLDEAGELYSAINTIAYPLRERSNNEHIAAIRDELSEFSNLAEL
ncbi:hypothetical protein OPIT5_13180 [Opitutaceae bacterium TAV5]|nr:hypothetical protein OPIT5_13180 [Opitutaceae bacterium TAV5]